MSHAEFNDQQWTEFALAAAAHKRRADDIHQRLTTDGSGTFTPPEFNDPRLSEVAAADEAFNNAFVVLQQLLWDVASQVARSRRLAADLHDDFIQDAWIHLRGKIGHFQGPHIRPWLWTVLKNLLIERYERPRTPLHLDDYEILDRSVDHSVVSRDYMRPVNAAAWRAEIDRYCQKSRIKNDYKYLFVFSTRLWPLLEEHCPEALKDRRPPSDWEIEALDSLARCNVVAFDFAEQQARLDLTAELESEDDIDRVDISLSEQEVRYAQLLNKQRERICQNLNRYYWSFLLIPSVWSHALRYVEPLNEAELADVMPDTGALELILQCDGWIVLPNPEIWERWLREHGLENCGQASFTRLFAFPPLLKSKEQWVPNGKKSAAIAAWFNSGASLAQLPSDDAGATTAESTGAEDIITTVSQRWMDITLRAAALRNRTDLPIPFERSSDD